MGIHHPFRRQPRPRSSGRELPLPNQMKLPFSDDREDLGASGERPGESESSKQ